MHWSSQSNTLKIKVKLIGPEDFIGLVISIFYQPTFLCGVGLSNF